MMRAENKHLRLGLGGRMALVLIGVCMTMAGVACLVVGMTMVGCTTQAVVDEHSPECVLMSVSSGSDLTESSQYVEVRLSFNKELQTTGDVLSDVQVLLNGAEPNTKTISVTGSVEGRDVVVRLVPSAAADGSSASVYFALYDGLLQIVPRNADGALGHVRGEDTTSNAVMREEFSATIPSGVSLVEDGEGADEGASVTFEITQFAQLRSCTWLKFSDALAPVMMHNHEFLRDTCNTCASRLTDTINATCADTLEATCEGAVVTVRALDAASAPLYVQVIEGVGENPTAGDTQ